MRAVEDIQVWDGDGVDRVGPEIVIPDGLINDYEKLPGNGDYIVGLEQSQPNGVTRSRRVEIPGCHKLRFTTGRPNVQVRKIVNRFFMSARGCGPLTIRIEGWKEHPIILAPMVLVWWEHDGKRSPTPLWTDLYVSDFINCQRYAIDVMVHRGTPPLLDETLP